MNQDKNKVQTLNFIGQTFYPLLMILFSAEYNSKIKDGDQIKFKRISCEYYYPFIYIFTVAVFQYLANKIGKSRTIKQKLIFCNIYILVVMPCLPLIQKYNPSRYGAFTVNCFMIFKIAMVNVTLVQTQLEVFLHYSQSKQEFEKKKFQMNQFHGLGMFSLVCLVYIIIRQLYYVDKSEQYFYYSYGFMFGLMYILNLVAILSFVNWLKQFKHYEKVINKPSNTKLQIHLIDVLLNTVYMDHQMILESGQSFSEVSSFDSLLSSSHQKDNNIALKVSLQEQIILDTNSNKAHNDVNCNNIGITNSQSQKIDKYYQDYIEQSQYSEVKSKVFWVMSSIFMQVLITTMFIIPFFQVDPVFQIDDSKLDQIYDKSIKVIILLSCQYIGVVFKDQFMNYNKEHFIILTMIRVLVITPIYMYVCMTADIDDKNKLVIQPIIMCISWLIYFGSMDINQIIINYQRHNVYALKESHRLRIGSSFQSAGSAGMMMGVIFSIAMIKLPQALSK